MANRAALPLAIAASWLPATYVFAFQPLVTDDTGTHANGNQIEFAAAQTRCDAALDPALRALRFSVAPVLNLGNGWTAALDLGSERATPGGRVTRSRSC